nr:MAG: coat protein [Bean leafroll virus]UJQ88493.1 MAG: coat protein [Bean leafroll virus]UJQ88498.1 MAG: coat protein [Bean leafroll virus]
MVARGKRVVVRQLQTRTRRRLPVVLATAPVRPQRKRRQRGRNNKPRGGNGNARRSGVAHEFVFSKDNLNGNSKGSITFGPSLSECKPLSDGILKAYHEYKITKCDLAYITEASSTSSGSVAYELDPHLKNTSVQSKINKFSITRTQTKRFSAKFINGQQWHDTSEDQFRILYEGNGKGEIAGSFRITITVLTQNPK